MEHGKFGSWSILVAPACASGAKSRTSGACDTEFGCPSNLLQLRLFVESQFLKPMRELAHRCCPWVQRQLPLGSEASAPLGVARGTAKALTVPVPHGIVSLERRINLYPSAGLLHCHSAGVKDESWVRCGRSAGRLLVGWCHTSRGCDWCGSRSAPVAVVGLRASKIGRSDLGSKERCGNLHFLSVSRSTVLSCGRHFASGIQRVEGHHLRPGSQD